MAKEDGNSEVVNEGEPKPEKVYAGKYKTDTDLEAGYKNLEGAFRARDAEIGTLRQQNQQLIDHLKTVQAQPSTSKTAGQELQGAIEAIKGLDYVDDAEASQKTAQILDQALRISQSIAETNAMKRAREEMQQILKQRDAAAMAERFKNEYPDFEELQNQGAFEALKSKLPMHDDVSSYFATKAERAAQEAQALKEKLAEMQKTLDLAGGSGPTTKVFTKPGASGGSGASKPKTEAELRAGALAAVRAVRGG